ncbi:hypothetical protein [Chryseobacterium sp.]|uniref:hypothetical protein n=1 Tax=Chryseobacterium sp. TaxID=1871047 RepID=UPI00289DCF05|nr:hypothetical protein [Chryseobacterium sp.]
MKIKYLLLFLLFSVFSLAQNVVSGKINDEDGNVQGQVLIINIDKNETVFSDSKGNYSISAEKGEELRFVKDGFYRTDVKVSGTMFSALQTITLKNLEIEIPEVELKFHPTGNLENDAKNVGISKRVSALNSKMDEYMKSPLNEPNPINISPKSFQPHDFKEGQVNLIGVAETLGKLIGKARKPKITKPNYYETKAFIAEVKSKINLDFAKKYGMSDEGVDQFLLYANDVYLLSKKYRKDFNTAKITGDLMAAFSEYQKLNDVTR